jgi:hypothetical protein
MLESEISPSPVVLRSLELALDKAKTKDIPKNSGILTRIPGIAPGQYRWFHLTSLYRQTSFEMPAAVYPRTKLLVNSFPEKQVKKISGLFGGEALVEEFRRARIQYYSHGK